MEVMDEKLVIILVRLRRAEKRSCCFCRTGSSVSPSWQSGFWSILAAPSTAAEEP